jgi:2,3-bisphosphoglycerate-dependent phosphoglycerate mutase
MNADGLGRLLLVRHTESIWNKENLFTGWVDIPLSEKGKADAYAVGRALRGTVQVDVAYTSGLLRAQQTLQLIVDGAEIGEIPITEDWRLNERFYGNWQGKNKKQTADRYGDAAVQAVRRGYATRPPGGESLEDTTERVLPYFAETIEPQLAQGLTVLIAAHGNSLRALVKRLDDLSDEVVPGVEIANGEVRGYRRNADGTFTRESDG